MQDSVPPHIARQVTALLWAHFGDEHVISKGFLTAWPPCIEFKSLCLLVLSHTALKIHKNLSMVLR